MIEPKAATHGPIANTLMPVSLTDGRWDCNSSAKSNFFNFVPEFLTG